MKNSEVTKKVEMILKVRSGTATALEAAKVLGISRKTYYQWEKKALSGMMEALAEKPPGRKCMPTDPEKEELKKKLEETRRANTLLQGKLDIRRILDADPLELDSKETNTAKKRGLSGCGS